MTTESMLLESDEGVHSTSSNFFIPSTNNKEHFETSLSDIFTVYEQADTKTGILSAEVLPLGFFEEDSQKILDSFKNYTNAKKDFQNTSIVTRYNAGEYVGNLYKLYHDIKVVSSALIVKFKVGSRQYKDIDFFYKFSIEVLLRETGRLRISILQHGSHQQTELEQSLSQDYDKVLLTYSLTNGEVITYLSKTQEPEPQASSPYNNIYANPNHVPPPKQSTIPLFSSLVGKSEIDTTPTVVADPYSVAKVVPTRVSSSRGCATLDSVSPAIPKFSAASDQSPGEILHDFFHPLWYTIPVPTWLNYKNDIIKPATTLPLESEGSVPLPSASTVTKEDGTTSSIKPKLAILQQRNNGDDPTSSIATLIKGPGDSFRSFAPAIDSRDAIVTEEFKGKVWLNHLGFAEIEAIKRRYEKNFSTSDDIVENSVVAEAKPDIGEKSLQEKVEDNQIDEKNDVIQSDEINVKNLVEWDPENIEVLEYLKKEKKSITESPRSLQRLISTHILKLNKLRQERFLRGDGKGVSLPSAEEVRLYNRVSKLSVIAINLYDISPADFSFQFSHKLPVLATEYTGVLPGIAQNKIPQVASQSNLNRRLPSIRGPYKKKNRF